MVFPLVRLPRTSYTPVECDYSLIELGHHNNRSGCPSLAVLQSVFAAVVGVSVVTMEEVMLEVQVRSNASVKCRVLLITREGVVERLTHGHQC